MERDFWHRRWAKNEIAFHQDVPNPCLVKFFERLSLPAGGRVFVPLCGKTLDIGWMLERGHSVAGAELSALAIEQLFAGLGVEPVISEMDHHKHYSAANLDIFVGDFFDLSREQLGRVDAVYDRGALVAFPEAMRDGYAQHLMKLTDQAQQLLVCCDYDQSLMKGPPFSISDSEVHQRYAEGYRLDQLDSSEIAGGLRGTQAFEKVWLLS